MQGAQDEVAGERRLHSHIGRLLVTNLTHHHDVRVLTQNLTQCACEGEPDLGLGLDLVNPEQLVLNRVLNGHNIFRDLIQTVQRAIQRRRFATTRGPRDENHPKWPCERLPHGRHRLLLEAQLFKIERQRAFIQHTHHDLFAVITGKNGRTEVDLAALILNPEAPVLRKAVLRDVKVRHNLDA